MTIHVTATGTVPSGVLHRFLQPSPPANPTAGSPRPTTTQVVLCASVPRPSPVGRPRAPARTPSTRQDAPLTTLPRIELSAAFLSQAEQLIERREPVPAVKARHPVLPDRPSVQIQPGLRASVMVCNGMEGPYQAMLVHNTSTNNVHRGRQVDAVCGIHQVIVEGQPIRFEVARARNA